MKITEFLAARLDEDEAAANAAGVATWREGCANWDETDADWRDLASYQGVSAAATGRAIVTDDGAASRAQCRFIARFDPARIMADCEAKRELIAAAGIYGSLDQDVLLGLAYLYADHPDYQPEWATWPMAITE